MDLINSLIEGLDDEADMLVVEDTVIVDLDAYRNYHYYRQSVCDKIVDVFGGDKLVIRKSYDSRQQGAYAGTGEFSGVKGVDSVDREQVMSAIDEVLRTFDKNGEKRELIIHRQYTNMVMCGVCYTRDILYGRPYYMVVYNTMGEFSERGTEHISHTKWIANNVSREFLDKYFMNLIFAMRHIERALDGVTELSVEFGIDEDCNVRVYQLKPMDRLAGSHILMTDREFMDTKAFAKCNYLDTHHMMSHELYWNPAQTIGQDPRPLDYSLYKGMLTSGIGSEGVSRLGYESVTDSMLHRIGNRPYVSIDNLLVGLTPAGLPLSLKYKLLNYYERRINEDKSLHKDVDKKVVLSAYNFSTGAQLKELLQWGFTKEETKRLSSSLKKLTENIINTYTDMRQEDCNSLIALITRRRAIRSCHPLEETNVMKLYKYINELVDVIKEHSAVGYTRQERCAFIATGICESLVKEGYYTESDMNQFIRLAKAYSYQFDRDFTDYTNGSLAWDEFNEKYGHLRLVNCDIRSHTYRQLYADCKVARPGNASEEEDSITLDRNVLQKALSDNKIKVMPDKLAYFIEESIKYAEIYKYEYSKTISLFLDIISSMGELLGIDREDMSYLELQDLLSYHSRDSYIQIIEARRNMYHAYSYLVLPDMVINVGDIDVIDIDQVEPDFITEKSAASEIVYYDDTHDTDVDGRIVLLAKSNQGFDWLFTRDIRGIITRYGNSSSDIAVKCRDYGVPAVIGCGDKLFNRIAMMKKVEIDCGNKKIIEQE